MHIFVKDIPNDKGLPDLASDKSLGFDEPVSTTDGGDEESEAPDDESTAPSVAAPAEDAVAPDEEEGEEKAEVLRAPDMVFTLDVGATPAKWACHPLVESEVTSTLLLLTFPES